MTEKDLNLIIQPDHADLEPEIDIASTVLPSVLQYLGHNEMCNRFINMEALSGAPIDFEIEEEQRVIVDISGYTVEQWDKDVEDIYDPSGTFRLRKKCGIPRVSIKIPIPERNTYRTKCCLRIEIKPSDEAQQNVLSALRDELLQDGAFTKLHKRATKIPLTDGRMVWLNQNDEGKAWIEVDGADYEVERFLPEGIEYKGHMKSGVRSAEAKESSFEEFVTSYNHNTQVTSRTAKGKVDTSVSSEKEKSTLDEQVLRQKVEDNSLEIAKFIWENKFVPITTIQDLQSIFDHIARLVNDGIQDGTRLRTWDVPYGYKVPAGPALSHSLNELYTQSWTVLRAAEKGRIDAYAAASWLEWMVDGGLHPFADGCGRIAKAWSAFLLCRLEKKLPQHESREAYYASFNQGLSPFMDYYCELGRK